MIGDTSEKETTAHWNSEMQNQEAQSKGGLLHKVPGYINLEMVDCLDAFCLVTGPVRQYSGQNLTHVKDPKQAVVVMRADAEGGYETVIVETWKSLGKRAEVLKLAGRHIEQARRDSNIVMIFDLTKHLGSELLFRLWPAVAQFPGCSVVVLVPDHEVSIAMRWVQMFARDWRMLRRWEKAHLTIEI
jgi:hypothetical protein